MTQHPKSVIRAKKLRANASDAEKLFWARVRKNKTGFQFRRQYQIGKYIADFVCIEKRIVIELDGDQHANPAAIAYDNQRTDFIKSHAWEIIRIPNGYIYKDLDNVIFCLIAVMNGDARISDVSIFQDKYQ